MAGGELGVRQVVVRPGMAIRAPGCQPNSVLPFLAAQMLEITRKV